MEDKMKEFCACKIDPDMPDFSKDPFFVKKHEEAKKAIEAITPEEWERIMGYIGKNK